MRMRKLAAGIATALMVAGGVSLGAAPAASAADLGSAITSCAVSSQTIDVTGAVGDTFTVQSDEPTDCTTVTSSSPGIITWSADDTCGASTNPDPDYFCGFATYPSGPGTTVVITLLAPGTTTWTATQHSLGLTINFTVTGAATFERHSRLGSGVPALQRRRDLRSGLEPVVGLLGQRWHRRLRVHPQCADVRQELANRIHSDGIDPSGSMPSHRSDPS